MLKKNIKTIPSSQINKEFVFKDIETYKISSLELINKHSEIKDKKNYFISWKIF